MNKLAPMAPKRAIENVWDYPRPPLLQRTPNRLRVIWKSADGSNIVIADTEQGYRVLETSHPPTYYLPPSSIKVPLTTPQKSSFCEWKGRASYHELTLDGHIVSNRIWSYREPASSFRPIKDYLSFYASAGGSGQWECYVDDEKVTAQEGDFYGGWVTSNIEGKMKGGPGTWGW